MKRILLCVMCVFLLTGCSLSETGNTQRPVYPSEDGLQVYDGVMYGEDVVFAGDYYWHGDFNKTLIEIPDGEVTCIGGNEKSGEKHLFSVIMVLPEVGVDIVSSLPRQEDYKQDIRVENVMFVVDIPASVDMIEGMSSKYYYPIIEDEDNILFLHPTYYLSVAKDHPIFTEKYGRLYRRDNGMLVEGIAYWDE